MKLVSRINKSVSMSEDGKPFTNRYMNREATVLHFEGYIIDNEVDTYYRLLCDAPDDVYMLQRLDKFNMGDTIPMEDNILNMFVETIGRTNILEDCLDGNRVALWLRDKYNL